MDNLFLDRLIDMQTAFNELKVDRRISMTYVITAFSMAKSEQVSDIAKMWNGILDKMLILIKTKSHKGKIKINKLNEIFNVTKDSIVWND